MILGIGVDVTPVARIERILAGTQRKSFLGRVFSSAEIEFGLNSSKPAEKFAGMFAAKEAVVKALGTGFSEGIYPGRVHIHKTLRGAPTVTFSPEILGTIQTIGVGRVFLSISHTDLMACAYVVIEKTPD